MPTACVHACVRDAHARTHAQLHMKSWVPVRCLCTLSISCWGIPFRAVLVIAESPAALRWSH